MGRGTFAALVFAIAIYFLCSLTISLLFLSDTIDNVCDQFGYLYLIQWNDQTYLKHLSFADERSCYAWIELSQQIKDELDRLKLEMDTWSYEKQRFESVKWSLLTVKMIEDFGSNSVPADIRSAVWAVEEKFGWEKTHFGTDDNSHYL